MGVGATPCRLLSSTHPPPASTYPNHSHMCTPTPPECVQVHGSWNPSRPTCRTRRSSCWRRRRPEGAAGGDGGLRSRSVPTGPRSLSGARRSDGAGEAKQLLEEAAAWEAPSLCSLPTARTCLRGRAGRRRPAQGPHATSLQPWLPGPTAGSPKAALLSASLRCLASLPAHVCITLSMCCKAWR